MIKVIVQKSNESDHLITTHEITSEDEHVVAAFLRSLADRYDPPRPSMRRPTEIRTNND